MPKSRVRLSPPVERKLAATLFNRTWDLLAKSRRTAAEREEMIHSAHASRYHWGRVGGPGNLSIAEWQLSRVYSVLRRAEPALYHAHRCRVISVRSHLDPFFIGYAYEALARASAIAGKRGDRNRYLREARRFLGQIPDRENRGLLLADLGTLP
jgi:hypothetical protein